MRKIDNLLAQYGESHQNETNKSIHWICVPLIFFSIVGLVASIPATPLQSLLGDGSLFANWAAVVLILITLYYITLSVSLAIGMLLFGLICLYFVHLIAGLDIAPLWLICIVIFIVAWIGQFYGHRVEGKKPSFFKDIQFLLIGPAWLMHFIYKQLGISY